MLSNLFKNNWIETVIYYENGSCNEWIKIKGNEIKTKTMGSFIIDYEKEFDFGKIKSFHVLPNDYGVKYFHCRLRW